MTIFDHILLGGLHCVITNIHVDIHVVEGLGVLLISPKPDTSEKCICFGRFLLGIISSILLGGVHYTGQLCTKTRAVLMPCIVLVISQHPDTSEKCNMF